MKRLSAFIFLIAVSVFFTGCYTQFVIPDRNYDEGRYAEREYNDQQNYNQYDSTDGGYRYYDDNGFYNFHYYSPLFSRYYWGYFPGRISFYDYGNWMDNYWGYAGWTASPFMFDFYMRGSYPWSYYDWPFYYPSYYSPYGYGYGYGYNNFWHNGYNGWWNNQGGVYGLNKYTKERNNDGGRLGFRGGINDRNTYARPYVTQGSTSNGVTSNGRTGTYLGKDAGRTTTGSRTTATRSRNSEKIFRDYGNSSGRTRSSQGISTPRQLREYTLPQTGNNSSYGRSRTTTNYSGDRGSSYSAPPTRSSYGSYNSSSSGGNYSSGSSSSGSSSSGSSSSGSRGSNEGGRGRGR